MKQRGLGRFGCFPRSRPSSSPCVVNQCMVNPRNTPRGLDGGSQSSLSRRYLSQKSAVWLEAGKVGRYTKTSLPQHNHNKRPPKVTGSRFLGEGLLSMEGSRKK